ncbi:MAG: hypothetical protein ACOYXC_04630 [Candidatus Rifleibacteriota bacterium]
MAEENRGQKTLHQVGEYFDKNDIKPPIDDPEKITLQSAQDNIKHVNRYFKSGAYDFEILLVLLFPAITIILFLILQKREATVQAEMEKVSDKDLDFIEMVRLQKGLEEFDRDFLMQLSFENSIKPVYQIFIDKQIFEKIESVQIEKLTEKGEMSDSNKRIRYLRKLKLKLF